MSLLPLTTAYSHVALYNDHYIIETVWGVADISHEVIMDTGHISGCP
jgi:hypothetical protein